MGAIVRQTTSSHPGIASRQCARDDRRRNYRKFSLLPNRLILHRSFGSGKRYCYDWQWRSYCAILATLGESVV